MIRWLQYLCTRVLRSNVQQQVYFIILQRVFKYLMCFVDFALNHQYYAEDVVRFQSVTKLGGHVIQVVDYLLVGLYGRLWVVEREPALTQLVKAAVLLHLLHLIQCFLCQVESIHLKVAHQLDCKTIRKNNDRIRRVPIDLRLFRQQKKYCFHLQFDVFCLVKQLKQIGKLRLYQIVVDKRGHGHRVLGQRLLRFVLYEQIMLRQHVVNVYFLYTKKSEILMTANGELHLPSARCIGQVC